MHAAHRDAVVTGKITGRPRHALALQILTRRAEQKRNWSNPSGDEACGKGLRVRRAGGRHAQSEVITPFDEIDEAVVEREIQHDLWITVSIPREQIRQALAREPARARHPQRAGRIGAERAELDLGVLEIAEDRLAFFEIDPAGLRKAQ